MIRVVLSGLRWWPEPLTERERERRDFGSVMSRERDQKNESGEGE